ncbi:unnamed protein product [Sphagnum compactum]
MLQEEGDDDDSAARMMLWETNNRRAAALPPLGRVLATIFAAECREVEKNLASDSARTKQGSVGRAVTSLLQHVDKGLQSGSSLDEIHVPLLEHAVKSKDHGNRRKVVALMQWLLKASEFRKSLGDSLAAIIGASQWDNRVKLGWCVVVRELVELGSLLYDVSPASAGIYCLIIIFMISSSYSALVKEEGKQRAPTRLTIAAADCSIVITRHLATGPSSQFNLTGKPKELKVEIQPQKKVLITPASSRSLDSRSARDGSVPQAVSKDYGEQMLWDILDDVILLVTELHEWNRRGRLLHAQGLQQVQKRLQVLAKFRDSLQSQGEADMAVGVAVMAACWRHYSGLILLEDYTLSSHPQSAIEHWLGALQHWTQEAQESALTDSRRADEMRGYALTCLALVIGRLEPQRLETILEAFEGHLFQALLDQVRGGDNEIVDLAVAVLRALLFRPPPATLKANVTGPNISSRMEEVVPMLMDMLDSRDSAARAGVLLVADFFALNPESSELEKLFARLDSNETVQRRNALDVLAELLSISTKNTDTIDSTLSHTIANHLFSRLGDEELMNRVEASSLFAKLDPAFTLATLVRLVYSADIRLRSAATLAVEAVLNGHANQCHTVFVLLDCLRDLVEEKSRGPQIVDKGKEAATKAGASLDLDRVLRVIPAWASRVQNWESLIRPLLHKMFAEASNPIIPRFLSHISSHLSDKPHLVFPLICQHMQEQPMLTREVIHKLSKDEDALGRMLFQRLSPMLALRILSLQAFDQLDFLDLYGNLRDNNNAERGPCIATLLLERMCDCYEFDDVRKVASELTGRLLPTVMLPLMTAQLEEATTTRDTRRAKACLFTICTSLMIRGRDTLDHPLMKHVQQLLSTILLWPGGSSEIVKAQHGCIDCYAAMICLEFQTNGTITQSPQPQASKGKAKIIEEIPEGQLHIHASQEGEGQATEQAPMVFRVCMANVLISAAQKISSSSRPMFAKMIMPPLLNYLEVGTETQIRGACLQVLFTAVYHLKGPAILPFANDLLSLSVATIQGYHPPEERMGSAKLLASLLAADEEIVKEIAPNLVNAQMAIAAVANMDASSELRALCEQLLSCMTPSSDAVLSSSPSSSLPSSPLYG